MSLPTNERLAVNHQAVGARPEEGPPFPLSYQQMNWLELQRERRGGYQPVGRDETSVNARATLGVDGPLDLVALQDALDEVVRRHESLRSVVVTHGERQMQAVTSPRPVPLSVVDLSSAPPSERPARLSSAATELSLRGFDLAADVLLRALVFRLEPAQHVLCLVMPHFVSDEWSLQIVVQEAITLYLALVRHVVSPLREPESQYRNFVTWQHAWVEQSRSRIREYYNARLKGAEALKLPHDYPLDPAAERLGGNVKVPWSAEQDAAVAQFCRENGVTPFMTYLAAYVVLLAQWTQRGDILIVMPVASRPDTDESGAVGVFSEKCPVRTDVSGNPLLRDVLHRVKESVLDALSHQCVPWAVFEEMAGEDGDCFPRPIATMHSVVPPRRVVPTECESLLGEIRVSPISVPVDQALVRRRMWSEVSLWAIQATPTLLTCGYRTGLFKHRTMVRVARGFATAAEWIVSQPTARLRDVPCIDANERGRRGRGLVTSP